MKKKHICYKNYWWNNFNIFERKVPTLWRRVRSYKEVKKRDTFMTYFTKKHIYWRPLDYNAESTDKKTYPYFKNQFNLFVTENEAAFSLVKYNFSICFSIPMFTTTYKNIKKFVSKIFKHTRSGKPYTEEAPRIEGCANTHI